MPRLMDEERHLIKVVLIWSAVTLVLLAAAIGLLIFGLALLVSGNGGGG